MTAVTNTTKDPESSIASILPQVHPFDEHNRKLLANTHPPEWSNPTPSGRYNLVVIGAGTAGLVTAAGAVGLGAKVALIERHLLGGDCLNVGCVPSKALIRSARAVADVREAQQFGVRVPPGSEVDFPAVMERMRKLRAEISPHDSAARFRDLGVEVFLGDALFTGTNTVEVAGQTLRFARACIATGAGHRSADSRLEGRRLSHERNGLQFDRIASPVGGHRGWPHRLRTGPGLCPVWERSLSD